MKGTFITRPFSPDGKRIVTASQDGTARVWNILPDTQALVSAAKAIAPRCLTPAQRARTRLVQWIGR
jgi:WD40 repeat protein